MFLNEQLIANGTTSLGRVVASKAILDFAVSSSLIGAAVNSGGAGYVVGETFDIDGGTFIGAFNARGVVTAETSGVVTACKLVSGGAYSALPGTVGAVTSNASAGGSGLTVDLTTDTPKWTLGRSTYVDDATDFEWLVTSTKASNPATVGLSTGEINGNEFVNLQCASGFDNGQQFDAQPEAAPAGKRLMTPGVDPQVYVSSTERRLNIMIRDGNFVQYGTIGLFIPFTDTEANYPFPGAVFGQTMGAIPFSTSRNEDSAVPGNANSGVLNAMPLQNAANLAFLGPYVYRDNLSTQWLVICKDTSQQSNLRAVVWPIAAQEGIYDFTHAPQVSGKPTNPFQAQSVARGGVLVDAATNSEGWFTTNEGSISSGSYGVQGVAPLGEGGRLSLLVQPHIIASQPDDNQVVGIIDGYLSVHGRGLTSFEEIVVENGGRYVVFPDTNSGDLWRWVAMEII